MLGFRLSVKLPGQSAFLRGAKYQLVFPKGPNLDHGSSSWWSTISTFQTCQCGNTSTIPSVWKLRVVVRWAMPQVLQNAHIEEVIKKANKKVFFFSSYSVEPIFHLRILWLFIVRVLDPFLNTVCQFFITHYLNISRTTLRGFRRGPLWECNYENNLSRFNLSSLGSRREAACSKLSNNMCIPSHKLHHLVLQRQSNPDITSDDQVPLMFFGVYVELRRCS